MRLSRLLTLAVVVAMLPGVAFACPVCFGDPGSPMTKGTSNGVFFLLAVVLLVQVGFAALFWSFWRRAKMLARRREQFRLIEGG